jgi:hypothetical protein
MRRDHLKQFEMVLLGCWQNYVPSACKVTQVAVMTGFGFKRHDAGTETVVVNKSRVVELNVHAAANTVRQSITHQTQSCEMQEVSAT